MRILTALYGGAAANALTVNIRNDGTEQEMPYSAIADILWWYYLNNGMYDELRLAGMFLGEPRLKGLRNPAQRVVKFYADTIWPGALPKALPLETQNRKIEEPLQQLWKWSNWQARKQIFVRWTAVLGEAYIKVAQPEGKPRIYLQLLRPEYVTERDDDEQGNIIYIRIDVPQNRREGDDDVDFYTYTEVWSKEEGTCRIWEHDGGPETEIERLGAPKQTYDLQQTWGIDFIPIARGVHLDIGEQRGVGAYLLQLDKIDEANRQATRLHSLLFRHNDVTWALEANMMDGNGRPLAPPRISGQPKPAVDRVASLLGQETADTGETVELAGEKFVRLPGMARLTSLVPNLNYDAALSVLDAHVHELEKDLPELRYHMMHEAGDLSGRAIRLLLGPAIATAVEVRNNLEDALIRAHKMALTIGQHAGIWKGLGSYEDEDLEHTFVERPIVPITRWEEAEIIKAEKEAGLPLFTSLRRSGVTEEEMAEIEDDFARTQALEQAGMAAALMEAQAQFDSGQTGATAVAGGKSAPADTAPEEELI